MASIARTIGREPLHARKSGWSALVCGLRRPAVLLGAVSIVTFILYSGTLSFEFVWDDKAQIVDNPLIRSLVNLHRAFISDLWYHTGRFQLYYRPLFTVWSILNYKIAGLHPWAWHLTAVLMHLAAVLAVFWLCRKLGIEYWTAALAAVIFALHPIHIECVAWISAVSDSMVTVLAVLSFCAFLNGRDSASKRTSLWRVVSFVLLACALLTKEIALGFFLLIAVYEYLYSERTTGVARKAINAVLAALPYLIITVGYLCVRKLALHQIAGKSDPGHGAVDMLLALPYVLVFYLRQLLAPIGLTGLYYTPYAIAEETMRVVASILILAAVALILILWYRRKADRVVAFSAGWMLISLVPALHLRTFTDGDFVRDRYIYLGSVGFAIIAAYVIRIIPAVANIRASTLQGIVAAFLCLFYVGVSVPQQAYWDSDLLVYMRGYSLYPENVYTDIGLAREYSRLGLHDRAIGLVERAHRSNPRYLYAAYALADVYIAAGLKDQGRAALLNAQTMMPEYLLAETGGATVAALWGQLGEYDRALELCSRVLVQDPELFSGLYNCGNVQLMAGHYLEAEGLLRQAVKTAPELASPRHFLGIALFQEGRYDEARVYLAEAVAIDSGIYQYHYWLARSFEQAGDKAGAQREYLTTLRINDKSADARLRLSVLQQQGRDDEGSHR